VVKIIAYLIHPFSGANMTFLPATTVPADNGSPALFFIFKNNQIALMPAGEVPSLPANHPIQQQTQRSIYLGTLNDQPCYAGEWLDDTELDSGWNWSDLRELHATSSDGLYSAVNHASQIVTWDLSHQFCPRCGTAARPSDHEKAKICPACDYHSYPRISPSIIVAITRGDELLLARGPHFPEGLFSLIAGFVDAGESLEEAVMREVREETGLQIKNIKYHSSQPWSFPHSLMIGFTAEYAGGTLTPCPVEIEAAGWYTADRMPTIPSTSAIARHLINDFLAAHS
jgi:NAD+ diphosphatase